jgi:hypothetical protein
MQPPDEAGSWAGGRQAAGAAAPGAHPAAPPSARRAQEPPPEDHPLARRPDVVCTPHLGASTAEAQEDVAVEIAEVVVAALQARARVPSGVIWPLT